VDLRAEADSQTLIAKTKNWVESFSGKKTQRGTKKILRIHVKNVSLNFLLRSPDPLIIGLIFKELKKHV